MLQEHTAKRGILLQRTYRCDILSSPLRSRSSMTDRT